MQKWLASKLDKPLSVVRQRTELQQVKAREEAAIIAADDVSYCKNCHTKLTGHYCHICGQQDSELRRPIWTLIRDMLDSVFSSDSRLLKTIVLLVLAPGGLTYAYMKGMRARFSPPLRLYVIVSVIFFLIISAANIAILDVKVIPNDTTVPEGSAHEEKGYSDFPISLSVPYTISVGMFVPISEEKRTGISPEHMAQLHQELVEGLPDLAGVVGEAAAGFARALEDPEKFNQLFNKWLPRAMFVLVPFFALLLRVFHWGKTGYYMHQLVFSLHFHSFLFLLFIALIGVVPLWGGALGMDLFWWGSSVYLIIALKVAEDQGIIKAFLKAGFIWVIYFTFMMLVLAQVIFTGLREL
ncbi:DUF3667 domain-containing protein [Kordiimonas pumila]|uniref:DUF3667 domain-containing protein n=1 Tax=Kordiimonas pumila TaxID=2161677 RepID=A0ABV7D7Y6_9PROT|nr:DUF3667 domain-containing protein [Kordiimonas pumila]